MHLCQCSFFLLWMKPNLILHVLYDCDPLVRLRSWISFCIYHIWIFYQRNWTSSGHPYMWHYWLLLITYRRLVRSYPTPFILEPQLGHAISCILFRRSSIVLQRPVFFITRYWRWEKTRQISQSTSPTGSFHHPARFKSWCHNEKTEYR